MSPVVKLGAAADGFGEFLGVSTASWGCGRIGVGLPLPDIEFADCLFVALEMVAFKTCVRAGLIPHAKQGGRGVCSLAVVGSKLDGTGFGKLQMVQTHVAEVAGAELAAGERYLESTLGAGEAETLLDGLDVAATARDANEVRLAAFGMSVTLGEDLRKPACIAQVSGRNSLMGGGIPSYVELISLDVLQIQCNRVFPGFFLIDVAYTMRCQVDLAILMVG